MADLGNLFFTLGIKMGDVKGLNKLTQGLDKQKKTIADNEKQLKRYLNIIAKDNRNIAKIMNDAALAITDGRKGISALTNEINKQSKSIDRYVKAYDRLTEARREFVRVSKAQSAERFSLSPTVIGDDRAFRRAFVTSIRDSASGIKVLGQQGNKTFSSFNKSLTHQNRLLSQLRTAASTYVSIWTAGQFLRSLVRITGEFELQMVSLRAMLNDINAADKIFSQTKLLAVESPFQFVDLMGFAKQLAAFSVPVNELLDTTKMLSDISAGLGVDMGRIVLAYSQIRSAGFLKGTELRQLTEAGVPVLEDLSRMFTQMEGQAVTIGDVFERISLRQVPFEMIEQVFKDMTSEGGKFYRMQEIQAETLRGQVSNLVDAWQIALYELGSSSDGILKFGVGAIRTLIENLNLVIPAIVGVASAYGTYTAAALIVNSTNTSLALGLTKLGKAFKAIGAVVKANPFVAILTALAALAPIIIRLIKRSNELENSFRDIADMNFSGAEESVYSFQKLVEQLKNAAKGSKDYSDAVMALNSRYGEYLPNMLNEADALETITSRYNDVTEAIYAKAQAQAYEAQMNRISEEYDSDIAEHLSSIRQMLVDELGMTSGGAADIVSAFSNQVYKMFDDGMRFNARLFDMTGLEQGQQNAEFMNLFSDIVDKYTQREGSLAGIALSSVRDYLNDLSDRYDAVSFADALTTDNFGRYDTAGERRRAEAIQRIYDDEIRRINADGSLNESGRAAAMNRAEIARLQALIELYGSPEFNNASKLNGYIRELNSLMNDDTEGWIKKAQAIKDIYDEQGFKLTLRPELESREEHIKGWKQDYDSAVSSLANIGAEDNVSESVLNALRIRIEALNELSNLLGYGNGFEGLNAQDKSGNDAAREQLDLIRDWIDRIKEVRDLYEEFRQLGVQDAQMMSLFGSIFGEFESHGIDSGALAALRGYNFDEALRIYNDMLRNGTPEMQAAADENDEDEALRNAGQRLEQLERAKEIGEQLQGVYEELAGIMAVSGTGVEHDFSKIVSDLRRQENELRRERDESRKDIEEKYGVDEKLDEYNSAMDAVDRLYNAKLDNLRANASEKIRDLASKYVDELIKSNRLDLSDYADKTIRQIKGQIDRLREIYRQLEDELDVERKDVDIAQSLGMGVDDVQLDKIEMLREALAQLGIIIDNTEDEKMKKVYDYLLSGVDYLLSGLKQAVSFMQELADVSGDVDLSSAADQLEAVAQNLGAAAEGASQGGWIGAIVGGVTDIINQIVQGVFSARLSVEQAKKAISEFQNSIWLSSMRIDEDDYDTVFGTNSFRKAKDAYDMARKNLEEYNKLVNQPMEQPETQTAFRSLGASIFTGGAFYGGFGKVETNLSKTLKDAYERGLNALQGIMVKTRDRNGFAEFFGFQDEYQALADYAPELFNDDGTLNVENAKLFLEEEHDIEDSQLRQLENAIELSEQYEEMMEIVRDLNAELMSEVSDDISNAIFDAVLNGADAWDAFNDSAVRVIDNIGRKMIQEFIVQSYLNQFQDELEAAWGKEDTPQALAEILFDIYGGLGEVLGEGMEAYQDWLDMMQVNGLDISSLYGQGESLGKDIQRITEDQADLLASYVNAIRAYVAQLVERGIATGELLTSINENINIALSVLKEINGNTQAINENTAQVGRLMKSLTTSGSSVAINARIM